MIPHMDCCVGLAIASKSYTVGIVLCVIMLIKFSYIHITIY